MADVEALAGELPEAKEGSRQHAVAKEMGLGASYERKVALVNREIRAMGFGKFQWALTLLSGGGWAVDNVSRAQEEMRSFVVCAQGFFRRQIIFYALSISLPQIEREFGSSTPVQFQTFALYVGLLVGATFWGVGSDIIGRRASWNLTLLIGSVFMLSVGAAPTFAAMGCLLACTGIGVGGNLPVDGMLLLEFTPGSKQWVVTLLSVFWSFGQLFATVIGWAFITNYSCIEKDPEGLQPCLKADNMGWRYTFYLCGGFTLLLWVARFFVYPVPESPKYLIARGRDEEAIEVLNFIAKENKTKNNLTLQLLREMSDCDDTGRTTTEIIAATMIGSNAGGEDCGAEERKTDTMDKADDDAIKESVCEEKTASRPAPLSAPSETGPTKKAKGSRIGFSHSDWQQVKRSATHFDRAHLKLLVASRKMALNTFIIVFCWSCLGLAYPLYNAFIAIYVEQASANLSSQPQSQSEQYRQLVYFSLCSIPGCLLATVLVELPRIGRRGAMAFFTLLTGIFLFGFTTARTTNAVLG
ncbi:hypothetical protein L7F22_041652 [Adiantum nelumboides]|nr:hypothetical protein [Adiantum nelumboides]